MKKTFKIIVKNSIIISILSILLSLMFSIFPSQIISNSVSALYTVIGILFSVAMSIAISFDLSGITNDRYYLSLKSDLRKVVTRLIIGIALATIIYIMPMQNILIELSISRIIYTPASTLILITGWMLYVFYALFEYRSDLNEHKRNSKNNQ